MADARARIRMSGDEVWRFLEQARALQVATLNRDGSPHLTTLWFATADGTVVFDTYAKSQKAVNVARDPRVALLAEAGETYETLRGVSINGTAELVRDADLSRTLKVRIGLRYHPEVAEEVLAERAERSRAKRVVIRVRPRRIVSWDHRKLAGA